MTSDDNRLTTATIVRRDEARTFFEGPEACREYARSETMWFGVSVVPPGEEGEIDPGHPHSLEVFYCSQGRVVIRDGVNEYILSAGDALLIPPSLPHAIRNVSDVPAVVVWAGAPGE
ncbi:MAG: cupin domain-containing protein [Streptosporangiaceae bacterium]